MDETVSISLNEEQLQAILAWASDHGYDDLERIITEALDHFPHNPEPRNAEDE